MKSRYLLGVVLLVVLPCGAQQGRTSASRHAQAVTEPDCPEGKGCTTFKQMWEGGDKVARSATWACFDFPQDLGVFGHGPSYDEFLLLRDGGSVFNFHSFVYGIENVTATANAESYRNGVAHWIADNNGIAIDVIKSEDTLHLSLQYTSTEGANVRFEFTMRLSSGRYTSKWTTEKKHFFSSETSTEDYIGQCIALPEPHG